jgi:Fe-S-cluster containining protein
MTRDERLTLTAYSQEKSFPFPGQDREDLLPTRTCQGIHHCQYHNPEDNTCGVYPVRPWECLIYPFLLVSNDGKAKVGVHLHCPYAREHRDDAVSRDYMTYLKEYFAQETILNFLRRNPALIRDYSAYDYEIEYLFSLPILLKETAA